MTSPTDVPRVGEGRAGDTTPTSAGVGAVRALLASAVRGEVPQQEAAAALRGAQAAGTFSHPDAGDPEVWRSLAALALSTGCPTHRCLLLDCLSSAAEPAAAHSEEAAIWLTSYMLYAATSGSSEPELCAAAGACGEAVAACYAQDTPLAHHVLAEHIVSCTAVADALCGADPAAASKSVATYKPYVSSGSRDAGTPAPPPPVAYTRQQLLRVLIHSLPGTPPHLLHALPGSGGGGVSAAAASAALLRAFGAPCLACPELGSRCASLLLAYLPSPAGVRRQLEPWLLSARAALSRNAVPAGAGGVVGPPVPPTPAESGAFLLSHGGWLLPLLGQAVAGASGGSGGGAGELRQGWAPHLAALLCCVGVPCARGVGAAAAQSLVEGCAEVCSVAGWFSPAAAVALLSVSRIPKSEWGVPLSAAAHHLLALDNKSLAMGGGPSDDIVRDARIVAAAFPCEMWDLQPCIVDVPGSPPAAADGSSDSEEPAQKKQRVGGTEAFE